MTLTFPRHYQRRRGARPGTVESFCATVEIEIGTRGFGETILADVEFEVEAGSPCNYVDDPGSPDEIEILSIKPFRWKRNEFGHSLGGVREYIECPRWLADTLRACVDESALKYEFSEDER